MDLHGKIMNIECEKVPAFPFVGEDSGPLQLRAYKEGHRDARHAAAELANETDAKMLAACQRMAALENALQHIAGSCEGRAAEVATAALAITT